MAHPISTRKVLRHYAWFRKNGHSPQSAAIHCIFIYAHDADEIRRRCKRSAPAWGGINHDYQPLPGRSFPNE